MKAGFSKVCMNPPYGAPIVGYYEDRVVKGIQDDLFVRATAFDDGEKRLLLLQLMFVLWGKNTMTNAKSHKRSNRCL